jgi:hypothetical protein
MLASTEEHENRRRRSALPEGHDLELTQSVLKEFAELTSQHRMSEARALLASVHPEEDEAHPALLHVIGAGSSALDEWSASPEFKSAARNVKLLKWSKPASKAARDVLDAALQHEAFGRLQQIVTSHGWDAVYEGVALATSSLLGSIARKQGGDVAQVASRLLPDAAAPVPRRASWRSEDEAPAAPTPTAAAPKAAAADSAPQVPATAQPATGVGHDVDNAVTATPVVGAVASLVEWVGKGKPVTASGQLRRADIEPVAALLGLHAQGVAKRPSEAENGTLSDAANPLQVRAASEITALALWWDLLVRGDVLQLSGTRVKVGDSAAKYATEMSAEDGEALLAAFVLWSMNTLLQAEKDPAKKPGVPAEEAAAQIGHALVEAANAAQPVNTPAERPLPQGAPQAVETLLALEDLRILGRTSEGQLTVPLGLRNAVLNAVAGMKAYAPEAFGWFAGR